MELTESGLRFVFTEGFKAIKYDATPFYTEHFIRQPGAKGVDFLADREDIFAMIEVKNCAGNENNNRWRIAPDNKKKVTAHTEYDVEDRESLDIEVAKKVAMSVSSLCGALSFGDLKDCSHDLLDYSYAIVSGKYSTHSKRMMVILFLEGNFSTKTRSEKMILSALQTSIKKKLGWLNCSVSVVNTSTFNKKVLSDVQAESE